LAVIKFVDIEVIVIVVLVFILNDFKKKKSYVQILI